MSLLVFISGEQLGNMFIAISVLILLFILAADICYLIYMRQKALKYKLLLRPAVLLNLIVPLFYVTCLTFYDTFGLKNFLLYYMLPFVLLLCVVISINALAIRRKTRRKSRLCGTISGSAAGATAFLISHKMSKLMAATLSENVYFLIVSISMLILSCYVFSLAVFDFLRYYYFTKLERLGLVTEEILKADE